MFEGRGILLAVCDRTRYNAILDKIADGGCNILAIPCLFFNPLYDICAMFLGEYVTSEGPLLSLQLSLANRAIVLDRSLLLVWKRRY